MSNEPRNRRTGTAEILDREAGLDVEATAGGRLPHVAELPITDVVKAFQMATRQAALDAVAAGRVVVGWKNGKLAEHGPVAPPASPRPDDRSA